MSDDKILIIATGGTIDSAYADPDHPPDRAEPLAESLIPEVLARLGFSADCDILPWRREDSSFFRDNPAQLRALAETVAQCAYDRIIITHGTDAMAINAERFMAMLREIAPDHKKTILFTGAIIPLANDPSLHPSPVALLANGETVTMKRAQSDGVDNLDFAIRTLMDERMRPPTEVRIAMQGENMDPSRIRKNRERGVFSPIR
jgi:L-asparaginase/Glu-tRNA(Gln) amidotransferase subunit D